MREQHSDPLSEGSKPVEFQTGSWPIKPPVDTILVAADSKKADTYPTNNND